MVFLNKRDIFDKMITRDSIFNYFSESKARLRKASQKKTVEGSEITPSIGCSFVKKLFSKCVERVNSGLDREYSMNLTSSIAVDRKNSEKVLRSCLEMLVNNKLRNDGIV